MEESFAPLIGHQISRLADAINHLAEKFGSFSSGITKQDLQGTEERIMATVAEAFAALQTKLDQFTADQAELTQDVTDVGTQVGTLTSTVADLKAQIAALNSGPGQLSPADQPALDKINATVDAADTQAKAANTALKALVVPTVPPVPPTA